MGSVCRDIAALVVTVDDKIDTHQFVKLFAIKPKHAAKVGRVVQRCVGLGYNTVVVCTAVDQRGNLGQTCNDVKDVLVVVFPVRGLCNAFAVFLVEYAVSLPTLNNVASS